MQMISVWLSPMRLWLAVAIAASASACSTAGVIMYGADAVSQAATGRTIPGHLLYAMTGKNCDPGNAFKEGTICVGDAAEFEDPPTQAAAPVYCYRTLGQVSCHAEPDPHMPGSTRLYHQQNALGKPPN